MTTVDWRAALRRELAPLLDSLARGEGASPAQRYRGEGFARAVCTLGLASAAEVIAELRRNWRTIAGDAADAYAEEDFRVYEDGAELPCIPVRLPRAPVFPGSST